MCNRSMNNHEDSIHQAKEDNRHTWYHPFMNGYDMLIIRYTAYYSARKISIEKNYSKVSCRYSNSSQDKQEHPFF